MTTKESGVIISGCPIVYSTYEKVGNEACDNIILRSGLLCGLSMFIKGVFEKQSIEFIESGKIIIAFKEGKIQSNNSNQFLSVLAYAILDNKNKLDKYISKKIVPLLSKILKRFILENNGKNFTEVSQFHYFKDYIDKIFKPKSKAVDNQAILFLASCSR